MLPHHLCVFAKFYVKLCTNDVLTMDVRKLGCWKINNILEGFVRNAILLAGFIIMSSGCAVVKTPSISGINQEEGKIKMTYSYGLFQKPDVKWDDALISANTQCKQWGYQDAQQSVGPQTRCIQEDQKGNCISWQVDSIYDCKLSEEQQIALNEKKQKALKNQQEEANKKLNEANNRKFPLTEIVKLEQNKIYVPPLKSDCSWNNTLPNSICVSKKQYDDMCKKSSGGTKHAIDWLIVTLKFTSYPYEVEYLFNNGGYVLNNTVLKSSGKCVSTFTVNGIYKGNSYSNTIEAVVTGFIYTKDNEILAHKYDASSDAYITY